MRTLRASVIRLAYERPELRAHLLPLVEENRYGLKRLAGWRTAEKELSNSIERGVAWVLRNAGEKPLSIHARKVVRAGLHVARQCPINVNPYSLYSSVPGWTRASDELEYVIQGITWAFEDCLEDLRKCQAKLSDYGASDTATTEKLYLDLQARLNKAMGFC